MLPTLLEVEDEDCKMLSVEEKWKLVFKEDVGPPMYRADEYAIHLMRWLSEGVAKYHEQNGSHVSEEEPAGDSNDNMYLNELSNITDLLRNLKIDLKLAHTSFHAEFLGHPHDGVQLLLNSLKALQGLQNMKQGPNISARDVMQVQKRAVSDEYECLISLKHATQCQDAMKMIIDHPSGLYLLAASSIGTFSKSRIVGLQLLTQACPMLHGHDYVLKAFSTLRLTVGEPVRFKLLIGMLNSPNTRSLLFQAICLNFLNALLETSDNACERVYIQCEMEEAGLDIKLLEKFTELKDSEHYDQYMDALKHWKKDYVDVENLVFLSKRLASDNIHLRTEVDILKKATKKLEEDKINLLVVERELTEQCFQLEKKISTLQRTISECESQRQRSDRESSPSRKRQGFGSRDVNQNSVGELNRASSQSLSPEAMSISSEEALKAQAEVVPEQRSVPIDSDIIVPHIQRRPKRNLWGGNNEERIEKRSTSRIAIIPYNGKTPQRPHSNSDYASLGTDKEEEEWQLTWRYPDIPQPIAIVNPVKSCSDVPSRRSSRDTDKSRKSEGHNKGVRRSHNIPGPQKLPCKG